VIKSLLHDHILTVFLFHWYRHRPYQQAITLNSRECGSTAHWTTLHPLALDAQRSVECKRSYTGTYSMKISHPQCIASMAPTLPCQAHVHSLATEPWTKGAFWCRELLIRPTNLWIAVTWAGESGQLGVQSSGAPQLQGQQSPPSRSRAGLLEGPHEIANKSGSSHGGSARSHCRTFR